MLYRSGDAANHALIVDSGHLQLTMPRAGTARAARTVALVGPGEMAGLECLEPEGRRRYTARAGERTAVRVIPGPRLSQSLQGTRWTLAMLFQSVHSDLALARSTVGGSSSHRTAGRLARVLLDLGYRFGTETDGRLVLPRWCTHQELADLCGAHRSTVTTLLNHWIYGGEVVERPGVLVLDPTALRARATE